MSIGIHFDDDEEIERDSAIGGIHDMVDSGGFQDLRPVCQCNVDVPQRPICSCYLPMPPLQLGKGKIKGKAEKRKAFNFLNNDLEK